MMGTKCTISLVSSQQQQQGSISLRLPLSELLQLLMAGGDCCVLRHFTDAITPLETLKGLGIEVMAVSIFAFLYLRESKAKDVEVAKLTREENLSKLKIRAGEGRLPVPLCELRGTARLVIVAGPAEFVTESLCRRKLFLKDLMERPGVCLSCPFRWTKTRRRCSSTRPTTMRWRTASGPSPSARTALTQQAREVYGQSLK
ncbi:hypothetical protein GUJ93_ZPchr0008g13854 [Zizania palustris]|uniref:Uncharacterized protein n=1 Tax=Zizania palustris TaxID=103762 RepID=A0A8J5RDC0_ZIZPA|nr:hypothetical protein GUJ93_ZPchr0008g13854 [Zizania palustris]